MALPTAEHVQAGTDTFARALAGDEQLRGALGRAIVWLSLAMTNNADTPEDPT
ncbi:MAG TPA: hypothetical protein VEX15_13205 [Nocardioidaceae bacterium]|nr:hypothetical protein [Nocardioidaceae bacterium]